MNIVAICPTVERLDLVQQLVRSWKAVAPKPAPQLVVLVMGEDDGTAGLCKNQKLTVIKQPEVLPFAKAVNLAAKGVQADWLLLLNNDLILQGGFFAALDEMIAHNYDIIGAKLLYPDGRIQHYGKWYSLDFKPFHVLRWQPADHPDTMRPRPFPDVTFACVAIRKLVWDELSGLDESYSNGYEDDDFCLRARDQGGQIGVHPGMLATHLESQTSGRDNANKEAQWLRFKQAWIDTGRIQWPLGMYQGWSQV